VRATEDNAKTPSAESGFRRGVVSGAVGCVLVTLGLLLSATPASAHFVRPFLRQITGTPTGVGGSEVPFGGYYGPEGIALDSDGDLWVGEGNSLAEFDPSGVYVKTLPPSSPSHESAESLAINRSTGALYIAAHNRGSYSGEVEMFDGAGEFVKSFGEPGLGGGIAGEVRGLVAVDNSLGSSAGSVYILKNQSTVEKFNASGEEEDFSLAEEPGHPSYVSANEISPYNEAGGGCSGCLEGLTVDSHGDVYVGVRRYRSGRGEPAVLEYSSAGLFLRAFTGEEVPAFEEDLGLRGGYIEGLAVDPTNGDLLVARSSESHESSRGVVDEFDSAGAFLAQITEVAGLPLSGAQQMGVDSAGDLYVINKGLGGYGGTKAVDEFGSGHFDPGLRLGAAAPRHPGSVVLNGSVDPESELNPERVGVVDCRFEYVSEAAYQETGFEDLSSGGEVACEDPGAAGIPKSDVYTPVHAEVTEHVESGVTYRYRLSATTGGVIGGTERTVPLTFTAPGVPVVSATVASEVTSTFAEFSADVDPLGADTTYQFQYLSEAQFVSDGDSFAGAVSAPVVPGDLGSGGEAGDALEGVVQHVGGLQPSTTYRFRVVASNEVGVSEGEVEGGGEVAHAFRTEPVMSSGLPDGRAYELVTPADKEGAQDMFGATRGNGGSVDKGTASESGDQFMLETRAAFGPFPASGLNVYAFSRHPVAGDPEREEWSYHALASSSLGVQTIGAGGASLAFSFDFSKVAFTDDVGAYGSVGGMVGATLVGSPGGPYTRVHADQATNNPVAGLSTEDPGELTGVVGASRELGHVFLKSNNHALAAAAGGLDEGAPALYESTGGECSGEAENCPLVDVKSNGALISRCGAQLGRGRGDGEAYSAVSGDGSRVFFTAPDPPNWAGNEGLNGSPGCGNPAQLYLRSGGEETIEVSAPEHGAPEALAGHGASFDGASEDGSRVFFTSIGELTHNDEGIHDTELYEYDVQTRQLTRVSAGESGHAAGEVRPDTGPSLIFVSGDGSHVYFVARGVLTVGANAEGREPVAGEENLYVYDTETGRTAFIAGSETKEAYTTPDGRFLLFKNGGELTPDAGGDQLYRYDAETGGLLCVSCNPDGVRSGAAASFSESAIEQAPSDGPARGMSDDGSYVFFDTAESLVPRDTNGMLDVYQWHEGTISLISSGQDSQESYFLDASSNGTNVFFGTHARLAPQDTDSQGDVYDARICSASEPCIEAPPAREGLCEGDACSHPAAAPNDATPTSLTFSGAGDVLSEAPSAVKPKAKPLTRAQRLAKALAACGKQPKQRRGGCEKLARGRYGPKAKNAKAKQAGKAGKAAKSTGKGGV
jgi:hypothetical protein